MITIERDIGPFKLKPVDYTIGFCSGMKHGLCCSYQDLGKPTWLYLKSRVRELEQHGISIELTEVTCIKGCYAGPKMQVRAKNGEGKEYCLDAKTPNEAEKALDRILQELFPEQHNAT